MFASKAQSQSVQVFHTNPSTSFNSIVSAPFATSASPSNPVDFVAAYWTGNGSSGAWRSFFKLDISSIPTYAIIDSAYFTFFADNTSTWGNPGSPNWGNDNSAYICRITSPWISNIFNWAGQPTYTTTNAALLPQSTSLQQDYLHIDATSLINDIRSSGTNNGFAFVLKNENNYYNSQIFHSSAALDSTKRPYLTVHYHESLSVNEFGSDNISISINDRNLLIEKPLDMNIKDVFIYDALGRMIVREQDQQLLNQSRIILPLNYSEGIYLVNISTEKGKIGKKIMLR